jgi:hypothetical protein
MPILKIQYDVSIWFGATLMLITAFFLMIKEDYKPPQTLKNQRFKKLQKINKISGHNIRIKKIFPKNFQKISPKKISKSIYMKKTEKYTFDDFFLDVICLWPLFFLCAYVIGNVIKHGL